MRTSATGNRPRGFTLLEVLVVVAIAGVMVVLAAVNLFPSNEEVAQRESGLLALAIEGARDDAWFGGRPVAVSIEESRLRRWRLRNDNTWEADPMRDQSVGADLRVTGLFIEGQPLPADSRLVFLPDGFGVAFRIALDVRGLGRAVEGDAAGAVRVMK